MRPETSEEERGTVCGGQDAGDARLPGAAGHPAPSSLSACFSAHLREVYAWAAWALPPRCPLPSPAATLPGTCSPLPPSVLPRARCAPAQAPARAGPSLDASFPPPRGSPDAACPGSLPDAAWGLAQPLPRGPSVSRLGDVLFCPLPTAAPCPLPTAAARGGPRLQWLRPHSLPLPAQGPAQAGEGPGLPSPAADLLTRRLGKHCGLRR